MRSRLHNATTPATYTNRLDRWNRPIREHWQTYTGGTGGGTTLVDFIDVAVTLNPDGMPLRRDGSYYPIEDSRAVYDGLGRIISLRHGTLDGSGGITIENGRREDALTFTQSGTVATWNSDLNFQYDPALNQGTTPNYSDLEETRDTRTLNLMDLPTARNTNNIAGDEYTIAYDKLGRPTSDGRNYAWVYDGFGRLAEARTKVGNALVKEFAYDGLGRVVGERYDTDATAGVGAGDPWYYKAYDGFSRHVATFRGGDASPKEIYTHHEMNDGGSQLAVRRDVDATGGGGWGGSSDGVLETTTYMLHRANGDVIAVVTGLTVVDSKADEPESWPGLLRERMDYVPGGDGAEPMRFSPADGYQIGGERGADGLVTGDDYTAFINDFVASIANGATDLNNNGVVDGRDFAAWNAEWDSGAAVGRAVLSAADGLDAKGPGNVRGRSADAGVALDAQLSGKVAGADGVTGRVRWGVVRTTAGVPPGYREPYSQPSETGCDEAVAWCKNNDPIVKQMVSDLERMGCMPSISCKNCSDTDAYFDQKNVVICYPKFHLPGKDAPNPGDLYKVCRAIAHELIHAADRCQTPNPPDLPTDANNQCIEAACREVRAVHFSGQCCTKSPYRKQEQASYMQCVRQYAEASIKHLGDADSRQGAGCDFRAALEKALRDPRCTSPDPKSPFDILRRKPHPCHTKPPDPQTPSDNLGPKDFIRMQAGGSQSRGDRPIPKTPVRVGF